jgi:integrase
VGRPNLVVGTYGAIRHYRTPTGWRCRTLFRDWDGATRPVERSGKTKASAEAALKLALRDRGRTDASSELTAETRVSALAEQWFAGLDLADTTMQQYRDRLDGQIIPSLGALRIRELTVGTLHRHLRAVAAKNGPQVAKMTRSVLSGMCGLAARHDALDRNPVRDVGTLSRSSKPTPRAMTIPEVLQLRALLTYDDKAVSRDLPDFVAFMLATGQRIGEASAVRPEDVDLEAGTVDVRGTVIRLKGQGLRIKPTTMSRAGERLLVMPSWCIEMLRRRPMKSATVFPAALGGLRDPSNTAADLREGLDAAGYEWVTSHVFRKTVATLMDEVGLSSRAAADQLGHSNPSLTQDVYYGRKKATTGAAAILEALD